MVFLILLKVGNSTMVKVELSMTNHGSLHLIEILSRQRNI